MSEPFHIFGADTLSRLITICDHASNRVPDCIGELGLPQADMERHIAYDIGAAGVSRALAQHLGGPAILSNFSRLVIDPNRGEDDPTLLMRLYDGSIIPANRQACEVERARRIDTYHRPYHDALGALVASRTAPVLISIHSFTPQLNARPPRPWHIGVLYAHDTRLAHALMDRLSHETDLCVGDNAPYSGHLPGDTMERHALRHGHPHVLIELRNDLIANEADQKRWAKRLAPIIEDALSTTGL